MKSHTLFSFAAAAAVTILLSISIIPFTGCQNPSEPKKDEVSRLPDSTSQDFLIETTEFSAGMVTNSFHDVWIFDRNNVWAAGYIEHTDSTATYNILQWNGKKWQGRGRMFDTGGLESVYALDSSHIYFGCGGVLEYKNGSFAWMPMTLGLKNWQGIRYVWASSPQNIWGVGSGGTIAHYDVREWKKIPFDENWQFYDITGSSQTGAAYACAMLGGDRTIIVELKDGKAEVIYSTDISNYEDEAICLEMINSNELVFAYSHIFKLSVQTRKAERLYTLETGYGISRVAAASPVDIYFFGSYLHPSGDVSERMVHYNGKRFKEFELPRRGYVIELGAHAIDGLAMAASLSDNNAYLITIRRR